MPTVTRAFAWQGVRITPGAHTLSQPAGPPDGLVLRTGVRAQSPAQHLGPRALHLTVGCEAHGPSFVAAFWARNQGLRIEGPKEGVTAFLVHREPQFIKLPHSNPTFISQQAATVR